MATPTYIPLDESHLSAATDGNDVPVFTQQDLSALVDELSLIGMLGMATTVTYSGGKVATVVSSRGTTRIRMTFAYHGSGPAIGRVDTILHEWSNDSGSTWALRTDSTNGVTAGLQTITYNGSGDATGYTWS